jgi:tetratricopeptide (TPR) repeat protein
MRKYVLCILVLALIVTIGCATTAVEKTKEAYLDRGNAYYGKGQFDKAIADSTKALELNPRDAKAYTNRGNAYYDKGQHDEAIADYTKAIELNPKYDKAYNNRGLGYIYLGEKGRACDDWRQACELGFCKGLNWAKKRRRMPIANGRMVIICHRTGLT